MSANIGLIAGGIIIALVIYIIWDRQQEEKAQQEWNAQLAAMQDKLNEPNLPVVIEVEKPVPFYSNWWGGFDRYPRRYPYDGGRYYGGYGSRYGIHSGGTRPYMPPLPRPSTVYTGPMHRGGGMHGGRGRR